MKKPFLIILTIVLVVFMIAGCGAKNQGDSEPFDLTQAGTPSTDPSAAGSQTAAQEVWNGDWFGFMWVTNTKGAYDHLEDDVYSAYLFINLNENDEGTLEIFIEDDEYPIVKATVIADDYHIEAVEGLFWDTELDARMWWTRFDEDFEGNRILIATDYDDPEGDGSFHYMFVFRPWGELWEQEEREGKMMPPGYAAYVASLGSGGSAGEDSGSDTTPVAPAPTGGDENTGSGTVITNSVNGVNLSVSIPEEGWSFFITESKEYFVNNFALHLSAVYYLKQI